MPSRKVVLAMAVAIHHSFTQVLHDAAYGDFPAPTGGATALGAVPGPCDSAAIFAHHVMVAADVDQAWVDNNYTSSRGLAGEDPSGPLLQFINALSARLGNPPTYASMLMAAPPKTGYLHGKITEGGEPDSSWAQYRTEVRCYQYSSPGAAGAFALGRGPGGRWEVFFRVDEGPGGRVGRELLAAAKTVVPDKGVLYGSTPLHDPRVIRIAVASGFLPICTEVLFLTRPRG
jgi:hypothetical protein